jgi:hypothetical protein
LALGFSAIVVPRWGRPWFALSLGIVIGVMMLTYVAVPALLVGIKLAGSGRGKMAAAAVGGTLGVLVCIPPYVIGRIGHATASDRTSSLRSASCCSCSGSSCKPTAPVP